MKQTVIQYIYSLNIFNRVYAIYSRNSVIHEYSYEYVFILPLSMNKHVIFIEFLNMYSIFLEYKQPMKGKLSSLFFKTDHCA